MDMKKNGRFLCDSEAVYGDSNEPAEMGSMGGHSHGAAGVGTESKEAPKSSTAIKTITKMTTCMGPFDVVKGDTLTMVARYDLSKHPLRQSLSGSKATDVMGMWALSFVPENKVKN
jgi:hypothetical protein